MTELGDKLRAIRQKAIDDGTLVPGELSRPDDEWWPLDQAVEWLRDRISEGDWLARNWDCKYIDARIDMRTGAMYLRPGNTSTEEPSVCIPLRGGSRVTNERTDLLECLDQLAKHISAGETLNPKIAASIVEEAAAALRAHEPSEKFPGAARSAEEMKIYQAGYDHGFRDGESTAQNRTGD